MKKRFNKMQTFTKKWVTIILVVCLIDLQFPFILAFLGRDNIAETLAEAIVTQIIAVIVAYMLKSFFETKAEKNAELDKYKFDVRFDQTNSEEEENE